MVETERRLETGERVIDVGSGAGFDSFVAADQVGDAGHVIGIDMTAEMLAKSRATAESLGLAGGAEKVTPAQLLERFDPIGWRP